MDRRRAGSRARAGRGLRAHARERAQPHRHLDPPGQAVAAQAAHARRRRRRRRRRARPRHRAARSPARRSSSTPGSSAASARPACAASSRCASASRVLGEHVPGAHADYCVVPVRNLHPKPEPLSFGRGRGLPARVRDGLAHADDARAPAARRMGARVGRRLRRRQRRRHARLGARGARDRDGLARRGARGRARARRGRDHQPPRRRRRWRPSREITGGRGVDVVYEHVGADTWATSIEALGRGGRLVLTGATTGGNPPARLHRIFWKQLDILGSTMASDSEFRAVTRLFAQGRIRPLVDSVRPARGRPGRAAQARGRRSRTASSCSRSSND